MAYLSHGTKGSDAQPCMDSEGLWNRRALPTTVASSPPEGRAEGGQRALG